MGKRGVQPKPTALKLVKGDRKDRINHNEPRPGSAVVRPPSWLSPKARKVWRKLAPDLESKRVLTVWDIEAFAGYCDAVVRRAEAAERLETEGEVIEMPVFNKNGEMTGHRLGRNPWSMALRDADAQVQRWGARFGLTPSERGQIKLPPAGGTGDDYLT